MCIKRHSKTCVVLDFNATTQYARKRQAIKRYTMKRVFSIKVEQKENQGVFTKEVQMGKATGGPSWK